MAEVRQRLDPEVGLGGEHLLQHLLPAAEAVLGDDDLTGLEQLLGVGALAADDVGVDQLVLVELAHEGDRRLELRRLVPVDQLAAGQDPLLGSAEELVGHQLDVAEGPALLLGIGDLLAQGEHLVGGLGGGPVVGVEHVLAVEEDQAHREGVAAGDAGQLAVEDPHFQASVEMLASSGYFLAASPCRWGVRSSKS
nr:hypothetical protein GCM10020093_091170 [Planobispora longispora]